MKIEFIFTLIMVVAMIIIQVFAMGKNGIETDKVCLCVWCLIALIWCYRATKS